MRYSIGLDLGGMKMLCAVLDGDGTVAARIKKRTQGLGNGDTVFEQAVACIEECIDAAGLKMQDILGIGFGIPGPVDFSHGIVLDTPNIGFKNFPLRDLARKKFDVPILVENDVNAGTYGEVKKGAALGRRHVIGLFPGSGLGAGLILDGKLYRGASGGAGEIGHMIIESGGRLCGCGGYGCLEAYVARAGMAKDAVALAATGKAPTLYAKVGTDYTRIKSGHLAKAAAAGEKEIQKLIRRSAWYLGIGMANCVNIFNPEAIVLGGGLVEKFGGEYVEISENSMRKHALPGLSAAVEVLTAELGDDAVAVGASILMNEMIKESA
jgi:glucokinase